MSDINEVPDESHVADSSVYTFAMCALYASMPQPSQVRPDDYILLPGTLGRCPECGERLEFRLFEAEKESAKISIGFRCLGMDLRPHFYADGVWMEHNRSVGRMIQSFYFMKWHGLPFGRDPNDKEREYVAWVMEDYDARSGEGESEHPSDSESGDEPSIDSDQKEGDNNQ